MIKRLSVRYCLIFIVFLFCFLSCKKAPDEDWTFSGGVYSNISNIYSGFWVVISLQHIEPQITQFDLKIYIHEKDKVSILYEGQIAGNLFMEGFDFAQYNVEYGLVRFDVVVNNKIRSYYIMYNE